MSFFWHQTSEAERSFYDNNKLLCTLHETNNIGIIIIGLLALSLTYGAGYWTLFALSLWFVL